MSEKKPIIVLPFKHSILFEYFISLRIFHLCPGDHLPKLYVWIHFLIRKIRNWPSKPDNQHFDSLDRTQMKLIDIKLYVINLNEFSPRISATQRRWSFRTNCFYLPCNLVPSSWGNRTASWNQKSWRICVKIRNSLVCLSFSFFNPSHFFQKPFFISWIV